MSDAHDPRTLEEPPPPPTLPRRVRLYRSQWIGLPLLLLLPLLAMVGAFGEAKSVQEWSAAGLRWELEYPTRVRSRQPTELRLRVRALEALPAQDSVRIDLDADYLHRFNRVTVVPAPGEAWIVVLPVPEPGGVAEVRIELEARRPWRSRGRVRVARDGGAAHEFVIDTFIFP